MNAPESRPAGRIWTYSPTIAESKIANITRIGTMAGIWFIGLAISVIIGTHIDKLVAGAMIAIALAVIASCSIWMVIAVRDARRAIRLVIDGQPLDSKPIRY